MYKEEELADGLVVDKEGYICGRIANFNVEPDRIIVNLYGYNTKNIETPDEEALVQRLLELVQKRFLRHESGMEEFYDWVRETLNLSNREPVTLEHLVEYAKTKNIDIPYKTQEIKVKIEKGSIDWSKVDKIVFTDLGKCVLLKEAVEAKNRGIAISDKISYKSTEYLAGRLIIDSEAKIVGSAVKFLIGSPPGILINIERLVRMEQPDLEALKRTLVPSQFKDLKHLFNRVKKDLRLKNATDEDLPIWAKRNNINVPTKVVERREVVMELPVDWNKIAKIGDVVILEEPIEVLIEEDEKRIIPYQNSSAKN